MYVMAAPSFNFGRPTASVFFAVAGPLELLTVAHLVLNGPYRLRFGDYLARDTASPVFHVEMGSAFERDNSGGWALIEEGAMCRDRL